MVMAILRLLIRGSLVRARENGNREPSVKELQLLAKLYEMTVDQILNYEGELPKEVQRLFQ
jgi:transcriptional regulator with XRE-family HTH domain